MALALMAYGNQAQPQAALTLPEQKKALRAMLAGPVLFNRERKIALNGTSADWCPHGVPVYIRHNVPNRIRQPLLGCFYRFVKDAVSASCASIAAFGGVTVLKVIHSRNDFFYAIGDQAFGFFRRSGFLCSDQGHGGASAFLGHGDRGGRAGNQNKARNGHGDFATGGSAHEDVSLALINRLMLVFGRGVSYAPLGQILRAHCAEKRDQLWEFLGGQRAKPPQLQDAPCKNKTSFLNASLGDCLRRVAHHDGLTYERRNPIFDGDTAR